MKLLVVDMPFESCKILSFNIPCQIRNFAVNFIRLLALAYTGKHIIIVFDDRKRKKLIGDDGEIPLSLV